MVSGVAGYVRCGHMALCDAMFSVFFQLSADIPYKPANDIVSEAPRAESRRNKMSRTLMCVAYSSTRLLQLDPCRINKPSSCCWG